MNAEFGVKGSRNATTTYPAGRLGGAELDRLTEHMNDGRGLFATGDYGSLEAGLGKAVDLARNMRYLADLAPGDHLLTSRT